MRIRYKQKQVNLKLYLGLIWLANGIFQVTYNADPGFIDYFWFLLSGFYLITYFYQKKEKYLTIENGIIKQNWPFGKKLNLAEIKQIKHFAGDYILKSENKQLTINIDLIDEKSLSDLKTELKKLNAVWN